MLLHNIDTRLKSMKMNRTQLEYAAGLPKNTIGKWDETKPSYDKVVKVARVLGCTVEELAAE